MYERNGEKYFVVDGHMHYWSAGPDNWVPGAEQYAEGWIKCFHAYQSLGPPATHWSLEHFETYSEDDRTIMVANPEDAAEALGFDLVARS